MVRIGAHRRSESSQYKGKHLENKSIIEDFSFLKTLNNCGYEGNIRITVGDRTLTTDIGRCGDGVKNTSIPIGA